ncbi:hypothetical protein [Yersinia ruckeri]|uniref:hypothetical protein n=1 Tax=Yersinia ruckeri TaxID=29486 RepID=UPI0020BFE5E1|nr:hypothetical protein [Yersinia ruckeri]MCK8571316.1 hypothetical protein [Yersinia ruckeri]MCK8577681.1 hypothetical protein [Yersinia ruckeri]MCK8581444.1 hypothetical protein [Yersinia ruckeri]UZX52889.1 hypothetical protein ND441_04925 [Yersinia ruckeri]UZX66123.1 hypothetical protein ND440_04755 [Yersinia ruckeri]
MAHQGYDNARQRRNDKRKALTAAYNAQHGIVEPEAHEVKRPTLRLNRKPNSRIESAIKPISFTYRAQIEKAAEFYGAMAEKASEKRQRANLKVRGNYDQQVNARQKMRGKSIPLI